MPSGTRAAMRDAAREMRREPTRSEALLWSALRRGVEGVRFRRQQPIGPFVVDFYCAAGRLVVEVDGAVHAGQERKDAARQAALERLGLRFLRLPADVVERDLDAAVAAVRDALAAATEVLPSPLVGEGPGEGGPDARDGLAAAPSSPRGLGRRERVSKE